MNEQQMVQHLKALTDIPGPVGRESLVQNYMEKQFAHYTTEIHSDRVGNLMAHFPGNGVKTVVAAHACEIGFIVSRITEGGLLKITPNYKTRNPDTRILPFHEVTVLTDTYDAIDGFFTTDTGHVVDTETRKKVPRLGDISVDIGADSVSEVKAMGIDVGCPLTWKSDLKQLKNRIKGKAMDDRLGLVTLVRLAEYTSQHEVKRDLYLASTVQEEIGVRGARALASQHTFDEAYILEIIPTAQNDRTLQLGGGPAIVYKDGSLHYHHQLIMDCKKTAHDCDIAFQPAILERGITDGLGFFANSASKTALLGCPTLYPHSPGETIDRRDLYQLGNLLHYIIG